MTLNMRCEGSDSNIYIYASSHEKSEGIKAEVVKPTREILINTVAHPINYSAYNLSDLSGQTSPVEFAY